MLRKASVSSDVWVERKSKPFFVLLSSLVFVLHHRDQTLTVYRSAFFHKKSFTGSDEPYVGQNVSFVFEEGPKGAAAVKVKEEEGGIAEPEEEQGEREMGKVKVCKPHVPIHASFYKTAIIELS